jgi:hypothetical protein
MIYLNEFTFKKLQFTFTISKTIPNIRLSFDGKNGYVV